MKDFGKDAVARLAESVSRTDAIRAAPFIAIAIAIAFAIVSWQISESAHRLVKARKAELVAFEQLLNRYLSEKQAIEPLEKRLYMPEQRSAAALIEETASRLGIRAGLTSFKPIEEKTDKGFSTNGVEAKFDGLTLNQAMNLVHRIETHRSLLLIKEFSMKSRFDKPDLFDVRIGVAMVRKADT